MQTPPPPGGGPERPKAQVSLDATLQKLPTEVIVGTAATLMSVAIVTGTTLYWDDILDYVYGDFMFESGLLTPGGLVGSLLWAVGLYFASPWQVLVLFLGKITTERPSDWAYTQVGRVLGYDTTAIDYKAPPAATALVLALFAAAGAAVVGTFDFLFEDATWGVSTGIGICMAAGVYELGRPTRRSVEEKVKLDDQWQTFATWADTRLVRGEGRCHFTDVERAFRQAHPAYRSKEELGERDLRNMIANWHPAADRTSSGYYKNLSVLPVTDPFTGEKR